MCLFFMAWMMAITRLSLERFFLVENFRCHSRDDPRCRRDERA